MTNWLVRLTGQSFRCRQMRHFSGDVLRHWCCPWRTAPPPHVDFHPVDLPALGRPDAVHGGRALDTAGVVLVQAQNRLLAGSDLFDLVAQHAAILHDRLVALAEMFL